MDRKILVALAVVVGLLTGYGVAQLQVEEATYCESVETQIRSNQTFNGTVDCFEPGVIPVNLSESLENRTDLRCVCRKSYQGEVQLFPVTSSVSETAGN